MRDPYTGRRGGINLFLAARDVRNERQERIKDMKKNSDFAAHFLLAQFLSIDRMGIIAGTKPPEAGCERGHVMVEPDCPSCRAEMDKLLDRTTRDAGSGQDGAK